MEGRSFLFFCLVLSSALSQIAGSGLFANQLLASPPILDMKLANGNAVISVLPPPRNHINTSAPAYLQVEQSQLKIKPALKTEQKAVFKLKPAGNVRFKVSLYLCDDKQTYCENHIVQGHWMPEKR